VSGACVSGAVRHRIARSPRLSIVPAAATMGQEQQAYAATAGPPWRALVSRHTCTGDNDWAWNIFGDEGDEERPGARRTPYCSMHEVRSRLEGGEEYLDFAPGASRSDFGRSEIGEAPNSPIGPSRRQQGRGQRVASALATVAAPAPHRGALGLGELLRVHGHPMLRLLICPLQHLSLRLRLRLRHRLVLVLVLVLLLMMIRRLF
jgi:hypothetical protein